MLTTKSLADNFRIMTSYFAALITMSIRSIFLSSIFNRQLYAAEFSFTLADPAPMKLELCSSEQIILNSG